MKNFILFLVVIFSFNSVKAQYITEIKPEPLITKECVPGKNAFTYWTQKLMDPRIISSNTSIDEYQLEGGSYFLIRGEEGQKLDGWPLLIKVSGSCWKVIKNFQDFHYDPTGQNYLVDVAVGDVIKRVDFYREAKFISHIWKKFPDNDFWKPKIYY